MKTQDLPETALFHGLSQEEVHWALSALDAHRLPFAKDQLLAQAGQCISHLGLVLSGCVHIEHLDVWGSKTLLGRATEGDLFAETYACLPQEPLLVNVTAATDGEALFLSAAPLLEPGNAPCLQHMAQNLLQISARKNLGLARRNLYTAPKTIRERVMTYFSALAIKNGSLHFVLPFDRQQLADFLGVDRSALSSTLSQMQRDGLLTLGRRTVELHTTPEGL